MKEAAGKITGDRSLQAEGAAEKAAGSVQAAAGKVAEKVRDAVRK
ncbi:CsbD family protein [Sphingopyxis sp. KK2]